MIQQYSSKDVTDRVSHYIRIFIRNSRRDVSRDVLHVCGDVPRGPHGDLHAGSDVRDELARVEFHVCDVTRCSGMNTRGRGHGCGYLVHRQRRLRR